MLSKCELLQLCFNREAPSDLIQSHGFKHHLFAGVSQTFISRPGLSPQLHTRVPRGVSVSPRLNCGHASLPKPTRPLQLPHFSKQQLTLLLTQDRSPATFPSTLTPSRAPPLPLTPVSQQTLSCLSVGRGVVGAGTPHKGTGTSQSLEMKDRRPV